MNPNFQQGYHDLQDYRLTLSLRYAIILPNMTLEAGFDAHAIGRVYDEQADSYAEFADKSFTWEYIEKPGFDLYIPDLYTPDTKVLELGCGEGRVVRHLISRGIRPQDIIGTDVSGKLLEKARLRVPGATFFQGTLNDIELPLGSFDLITANMVFHHMDNETLEKTLDRIYELLSPKGQLFFVDTDPDHNLEGKLLENENRWFRQKTPWGTEIPYFNRHPSDFLEFFRLHGFDMTKGWPLKVSEEGNKDPKNYLSYLLHPSRMAARFKKTTKEIRSLRLSGNEPPLFDWIINVSADGTGDYIKKVG